MAYLIWVINMNYDNIFFQVLQLVDQRPSKKWQLEEVSKQLGYSPFHFHRIFKKVSGETFQSFINNRRLSYSAKELITTSNRILDIALDFQFGSHEAYSRAFKRTFHMTPTLFRENPLAYSFFEQNFLSYKDSQEQLPKLEYIPSFSHNGIYSQSKLGHDIGKQWAELTKQYSLKYEEELIGVIQPNATTYSVGVKTGKGPIINPYLQTTVPSNWYVTMNHLGTYHTIKDTYQFLYTHWLPTTSFSYKNDPELEVYQRNQPVKICIPISGEGKLS